VCCLLAAPLFAGDESKAKEDDEKIPALQRPDPKVRLPESARAKKDEGGYGVVVNLDAAGKLAAGDKPGTLEALGKALAGAVESRKEEMDGIASTMRVLLRLDENAPWIHAQWLMVECAQRRVNRVEIAARRADGTPGYLKCWLPVDAGVGVQAPKADKVRIDVVARAEKAARYGDLTVLKPTSFVYRIGTSEMAKPEEVGTHLAKLRAKARKDKRDLRFEVRAGHKVPLGIVAGVLDACEGAGVEGVEFYGTSLPSDRERTAAPLPYPQKNYVTR
jgi:biopolymer transport protein ExbD